MKNELTPPEKELKQKTNRKLMIFVAVSVVLVFVLVAMVILFSPSISKDPLKMHLLGVVEGVFIMLVSHFFGDSVRNDK